MGNVETKEFTEQQQYINQLHAQIKSNKQEIDRFKLMNMNMRPGNTPGNNLNNNNNISGNNISGNNISGSNISGNNFGINKAKPKKTELIQIINKNTIKINKLNDALLKHKHVMNASQLSKIKLLKESLTTSNEILKDQLNDYTNYNDYNDNNNYAQNNSLMQTTHNQSHSDTYNSISGFNQGTSRVDPTSRQLQTQMQNDDISILNRNYKDDDAKELAEFELEEKRRRRQFLEKQRKRRLEYQNKLDEIEKKNIDAIKLFGLSTNYSLKDLKTAYKKLAIKTHPDRPEGSNQKFQLVTKCYLLLLEKYKLRESDKHYNKLRDESKKYMEQQNNKSAKFDKENFNLKLFNKIYEQNKLWDPNDEGYENWLKNDDDSSETPLFNKKFNIDIFNSTFNSHKNKNSNQIVKYDNPSALVLTKSGFTEIDNSNQIDDYTKTMEGQGNLQFTDLKVAYTNKGNLINPDSVEYKQYNSVDELKRDRSKISYIMSPEDIRAEEMRKQRERIKEEERQKKIRERDLMIANNYSQVHKYMLGN